MAASDAVERRRGPWTTSRLDHHHRLRSGDEDRDAIEVDGSIERARLETGGLVAFEVRVVTEEEQAFQSFGFEQDLVRYPLTLDLQILDQRVDGLDHVTMYHLVAAGCVDIASDSFGERLELTGRIPPPTSCECLFEITALICN